MHTSEMYQASVISERTSIFVTTSFESIHAYPNAPEEVAFLRNPHRHVFHVKLMLAVTHDDRELEFILVKRALNAFLPRAVANLESKSCEMIAKLILNWATITYGDRESSCEVSEDQENGALVVRTPVRIP